MNGVGGAVGEFSLPLSKINCLFLSLILGRAVEILLTPPPHRPYPVSLPFRRIPVSSLLTSCRVLSHHWDCRMKTSWNLLKVFLL